MRTLRSCVKILKWIADSNPRKWAVENQKLDLKKALIYDFLSLLSALRWLVNPNPQKWEAFKKFLDRKTEGMTTALSQVLKRKITLYSIIVLAVSLLILLVIEKSNSLPKIISNFTQNLEAIAIFSAAIIFILEGKDRQKQNQYEAWRVINSAQGQAGNGGRILALKDLKDSGASLECISASGSDLSSIDLSYANLKYADFRKSVLDNAQFQNADLSNANLEGAKLRNANLANAILDGANLNDAILDDANLNGAKLSCATLNNTSLARAQLDEARLDSSEGEKVNFRLASFANSSLRRARFLNSNLTRTKLEKADLTEAILEGSDLSGANLQGATLTSAYLDRAIFSDGDGQQIPIVAPKMDLKGAQTTFTEAIPTNLSGAKNIPSHLKEQLNLPDSNSLLNSDSEAG
jgi:uncharacterized protein YjbI with pentapeptide repeats